MSAPFPLTLVIGCGSIVERHVRTFLGTGRASVLACDNRATIRDQIVERYGVQVVPHWKTALENPAVTNVVIATPAPSPVAIGIPCLEAGRHVLIEKPLSLDMAGIDALVHARDRAGLHAAVAYMLHFVPALQVVRDFLRAGSFGANRHPAVNPGQYFPHFRPAYREDYDREHAQGVGAIQDALTHMANAVESGVGPITRLFLDASTGQPNALCTLEEGIQTLRFNLAALQFWSENRFMNP